MVCLGFDSAAPGWQAQTKPWNYGMPTDSLKAGYDDVVSYVSLARTRLQLII